MEAEGQVPTYLDSRLLLRPEEAAAVAAISRSRIFAMIADGSLPSIKIGKSRRISVDALRDWIKRQSAAA